MFNKPPNQNNPRFSRRPTSEAEAIRWEQEEKLEQATSIGKHPFQNAKYSYNLAMIGDWMYCKCLCKKKFKRIHRFAVAKQYLLDELDIVDLVKTTREVKLMRSILLKES